MQLCTRLKRVRNVASKTENCSGQNFAHRWGKKASLFLPFSEHHQTRKMVMKKTRYARRRVFFIGAVLTCISGSAASQQSNLCIENGGQYQCTSPVLAPGWVLLSGDAAYRSTYAEANSACYQGQITSITGYSVPDSLQKYTSFLTQNVKASCWEVWPDQAGQQQRGQPTLYYSVGACNAIGAFDGFLEPQAGSSLFAPPVYDPAFRVDPSTCTISFQERWPGGSLAREAQSALYPIKRVSCAQGLLTGDGVTEPYFCIEDGNGKPENRGDPCEEGAGNPINVSTGNKYQVELDYRDRRGLLALRRYYNSQGGSSSFDLGTAWRHSYDASIELRIGSAKTLALVHRSDGKILTYEKAADGSFRYANDSGTYTTGGTYRLTATYNGGVLTGYRFIDTANNTIEAHNPQGKLQSVTRTDGYAVVLGYNGITGLLSTATDSFGRTITFERDAIGTISAAVDPAGGRYLYEFGQGASLTKVTYPDLTNRQYPYATLGQLTGIIDENGAQYATFAYKQSPNLNEARRAVSTEHAGGVEKYSLQVLSYPTSANVTDPLGTVSTRSFSVIQNVSRLVNQTQAAGAGSGASAMSATIDSIGRTTETANFNGTATCYDFNGQFNSESVRVEGTGPYCASKVAVGAILYADERKISTSWHPDWSIRTKVAEPKRITTWVYNGQSDPFSGGIASCAPASAPLPNGKPVAVLCKQVEQATTDANGSQGFAATLDTSVPARVRSYTYNQYGQILTATDPRGYSTTYVYYADSTSDHWLGDLRTATNAAGHVTTFTSYDRYGQPLQVTDAKGNVTTITYDLRQRPLIMTTAGLATAFEYDAAGQMKKVTLPSGVLTQFNYDAAHRLTGITDGAGSSITYTLDGVGNRAGEAVRDSSGTLERTVSRVFDALGRLQSVTGAAK